ncbi:hypothetical protein D1B31_07040 [Neobacillus notoginsengisoli]|uniref:Uncharacterized protein n=1 Tax=Neobacillus notoginsengisoli TaxID=1578198 RepID=A0A417YVU7_9BACI|nr:hypothetical protein D1B31_07040 [Neobacillus notoginsengisoli]
MNSYWQQSLRLIKEALVYEQHRLAAALVTKARGKRVQKRTKKIPLPKGRGIHGRSKNELKFSHQPPLP